MPCMEGMVMSGCVPADKQQTEQHQGPPEMQMAMRQTSPGHDMPAPELLKNVASRPAVSLEDFLKLGDANNPTIKEANAFVQQSQQQARQAALYPNPSIGYQGEQIRGGSYGGGEQGGFLGAIPVRMDLPGRGVDALVGQGPRIVAPAIRCGRGRCSSGIVRNGHVAGAPCVE